MKHIEVINYATRIGVNIVPVESCTGGRIVSTLTDVPGSSAVVMDGFTTYSNEAKIALGVPQSAIEQFTVYSQEVAAAMAYAGVQKTVAPRPLGIGITGSLSRVDPLNSKNSEPGTAHVGFYFEGKTQQYTIHTAELDRERGKADFTAQTLELLLTEFWKVK